MNLLVFVPHFCVLFTHCLQVIFKARMPRTYKLTAHNEYFCRFQGYVDQSNVYSNSARKEINLGGSTLYAINTDEQLKLKLRKKWVGCCTRQVSLAESTVHEDAFLYFPWFCSSLPNKLILFKQKRKT